MAIGTSFTRIIRINPSDDCTEVEMFIHDGEDAPYNFAYVTVYVENRDWILSDLKAEVTRKAKTFLSQAVSALPD